MGRQLGRGWITDPEKSRKVYEALGLEFRRHFCGVPGQEEELELTYNHDA
jgi:hypothetical protein